MPDTCPQAVHTSCEAMLAAGVWMMALRAADQTREHYYGCFVRDLGGHKIEASYWDMQSVEAVYVEADWTLSHTISSECRFSENSREL